MDAGEQAIPDVAPQVLPAQPDGFGPGGIGGIGEKRDHLPGKELHENAADQAEARGDIDGIAQRLAGTVLPARADILRAERRYGGQHGGRHQEQKADDLFHDADRGGVNKPAAVGDDGDEDEGDLDQAILQRHRHADAQNLPHDRATGFEIAFLQRDAGMPPVHGKECRRDADRLGNGGAQRGADRPQPQHTDEQVIQPDIGRAGHRDEVHGASAIPQAPVDGAEDIVGGDEGDADEADGEIGDGPFHRLLRGGHDRHDGPHQKQQSYRKDERYSREQRDGIADIGGGPLAVPRADGVPDADGGAHGKSHQHHGEHMHHLAADRDRRSAGDPFVLADDEQIRHAVEGLQKVRKQVRQRKAEDAFPYAAGGEIAFHCDAPRPGRRCGEGCRVFLPGGRAFSF